MYVAASILSADFAKLGEEINAVSQAGADLIHFDVMDGHFVPNLTIGNLVATAASRVSPIPLDIHLMTQNVPFFIEHFLPSKPKFMSFHIEADCHILRQIDLLRKNGVSPAVALCPHTPLHTLDYILNEVDMVLVMSVNPGFGGQKFIPSALRKIAELREVIERCNAKCLIEVDGGVSGLNAAELNEAGADILVAGSFIFGSNDYKSAVAALKAGDE